MKSFRKDFLGNLVQDNLMGQSTVMSTDRLPISDQLEFWKTPNGAQIRHDESLFGDVSFKWDRPLLGPPPSATPLQFDLKSCPTFDLPSLLGGKKKLW